MSDPKKDGDNGEKAGSKKTYVATMPIDFGKGLSAEPGEKLELTTREAKSLVESGALVAAK
jgi:hypothetical protein